MNDQGLTDLKADSADEVITSHNVTVSPSREILKHSDDKVNEQQHGEHIISNSGYASRNNFGSGACVNDYLNDCNNDTEFMIDENARSFESVIDEGNESTTDMDASSMSFSRINFVGK